MGAYCASKAVVIRLTESLADELKGRGINVNCVLPSIIDTARNRQDMPSADPSLWVKPSRSRARDRVSRVRRGTRDSRRRAAGGSAQLKSESIEFESAEVRCWHEGSDALIVTLTATRPTISSAVLDGFERAIALAQSDFQMLVIEGQRDFAYGADLNDAFAAAATGQLDVLDRALDRYQRTMLALRHAAIPTIAVTRGVAISGGCEVLMHCTRVVAAPTSPIGLVETSVGVLPGGGGVKEMARRAMLSAAGGDLYPGTRTRLQGARVLRKSSAHGTRRRGTCCRTDDVVVDGDLLAAAKELGRSLQRDGYRPPPHNPTIRVGGDDALERLLESQRTKDGSELTAHQLRINAHVAEVLCGGRGPARDVSEQTLLDLERRHFLVLVQTAETQARLAHLRETGTTLRN